MEHKHEIKQIKHQAYKMSWYLRGGVDASTLLYDTDLEDMLILDKVVKENIELAKSSGMPLI